MLRMDWLADHMDKCYGAVFRVIHGAPTPSD